MIECLCPNNHKIRCPDDLAGRAAKCPKCGMKFPIPSNEAADKPAADEELGSGLVGNMADSHISLDAWEKPQGESSRRRLSYAQIHVVHQNQRRHGRQAPSRLDRQCAFHGPIVRQLWAEKPKDAILEIILRNGEVYKPDLYSKKLSLQNQGVFAAKEMDGTYTIFVVSWDALSHMQIRKMRDLPGDFD